MRVERSTLIEFPKPGGSLKTLALMLTTAGVMAVSQLASAYTACSCFELNRRVQGLEYALQSGRVGGDYGSLQRNVQDGRNTLYQSSASNSSQQESVCSGANQRMDYDWSRWQPFVARSGRNIGNPCER